MNHRLFIENISGGFPYLERRIYTYRVCFCQRTLATIAIFLFEHAFYIESTSGVFPHLERRIYTHLVCFCKRTHIQNEGYTHIVSASASALQLRSIFPFEQESDYEPHAFYRRYFWWFSIFRTKKINTSCLFLPAHSSYDRYSFSSRRLIESISGVFPHSERRIYTYLVCFCQRTHIQNEG